MITFIEVRIDNYLYIAGFLPKKLIPKCGCESLICWGIIVNACHALQKFQSGQTSRHVLLHCVKIVSYSIHGTMASFQMLVSKLNDLLNVTVGGIISTDFENTKISRLN